MIDSRACRLAWHADRRALLAVLGCEIGRGTRVARHQRGAGRAAELRSDGRPAAGGAAGADHIYVLHRGRVLEHGDHAGLMTSGGTYAQLFALQAAQYGII